MTPRGYRSHLQYAVAQSAAPYGYTLTMWTSGAVTITAEGGGPSTLDALLLLAGAVGAFTLVGLVAYGGWRHDRTGATPPTTIWAGIHLVSVGTSVLLCSLLAHTVRGHPVWPLVGFTATTSYLLALALQQEVSARFAGSSRRRTETPPRH